MSSKQLERFCPLSDQCKATLEKLIDRLNLSARAYTRIIKIARTIADLQAATESVRTGIAPVPGPILPSHLLEAAGYRFLDRRNILDL